MLVYSRLLEGRLRLAWEPQDYISAFCRWCVFACFFDSWTSAHTGKVCSWVWRDGIGTWCTPKFPESGYGSLLENGVLLALGGWEKLLTQARKFKYLGVLFTSDLRMEWEMGGLGQRLVMQVPYWTVVVACFTGLSTFRTSPIVLSSG